MEAFNGFEPSFFQALQQARYWQSRAIAARAEEAYRQTLAARRQTERVSGLPDAANGHSSKAWQALDPSQQECVQAILRSPQQQIDQLISGLQILAKPVHWQLSVTFSDPFEPPIVKVQRLSQPQTSARPVDDQNSAGGSIDFYC